MNREIYEIINDLNKIYQLEEIRLTKNVEYIINNNITDISIIEKTMDEIVSIPTLNNLALRLNDYYFNIDKDNAKEYKKIINNSYGGYYENIKK